MGGGRPWLYPRPVDLRTSASAGPRLRILLLLLAGIRDAERRKLSLLARCLLASLFLHMLLMLLFNVWGVTSKLAYALGKKGPIQVALVASAACYVFATFLLFKAVAWIGPLRTGVMDTSAPVWALIFGMVILDQSLSALQITGAALVIAGIAIIQLRSHQPVETH